MTEPEVALFNSYREWTARLSTFAQDHGGFRERVRVSSATDALEQSYHVLVVDDATSFLSPRFVNEVHARGAQVLGLYDPKQQDYGLGREHLERCGVDALMEDAAEPEEFVATIAELAGRAQVLREAAAAVASAPPPPPAGGAQRWRGTITTVGAASPGAGATEVAIALAATAARRDETAVLVDADDVDGSIAQRLGLPQWPNIRAVAEAVDNGRLDDKRLLHHAGALDVVTGLASKDWPSLQPLQLDAVLRELAGTRHHVVVNVGHRVEDLSWLAVPERYGLTRAAMGTADVLVGVCEGSPTGVRRSIEWVADVSAIAPGTPVHIVVNKAPGSSYRRAEIERQLTEACSPASVSFTPLDETVEEAHWDGTLVTRGRFAKAIDTVAAEVLPQYVAASNGHHRWWRPRRG